MYFGFRTAIIVDKENTILACGENFKTTFTPLDFPKLSDDYVIATGYLYLFVYNCGKLYSCGMNVAGELGVGDNVFREKLTLVETDMGNIIKIHCGYTTTYVINDKNQLFGTGNNRRGQLAE
jgi:alpha-tubulin suppressor-like RCC1 family protein